jgi:hypothetical protein
VLYRMDPLDCTCYFCTYTNNNETRTATSFWGNRISNNRCPVHTPNLLLGEKELFELAQRWQKRRAATRLGWVSPRKWPAKALVTPGSPYDFQRRPGRPSRRVGRAGWKRAAERIEDRRSPRR